MVVESLSAEIMAVLFSAIFSYIACYLIYNRFSVAVWGLVAAFLPRIPVAIVGLTGGTNLLVFAWLSHTVGVILYSLLLVIADILLLEIALIKIVRPISFIMPKGLQTAIKAESMLSRLQEYHAVPRPVRLQWVFGAGMFAGIINLVFVVGFGVL